jgi:hypothetical protein
MKSGLTAFADDAAGLHSTDVVWDDANPDQIAQLPLTAPHRDVDLEITQADDDGYVRTYIVMPATVYGIASGKFVNAGLMNKHSIRIPALITISLDRGQAGMVGKGLNLWPNVHIGDSTPVFLRWTLQSCYYDAHSRLSG